MSDNRLIPESMVKLLFDQVKDSSDKNADVVREMSGVLRDLSTVINSQIPTRKELCDMVKDHDRDCAKRGEEIYNIIEKEDSVITEKINNAVEKILATSKTIDDNTKSLDDVKTTLKSIDDDVKSISDRIRTMIIVVTVAFSLTMMIFFFVKSANDTMINNAVKEAVKEIITSRPSNIWPLPQQDNTK